MDRSRRTGDRPRTPRRPPRRLLEPWADERLVELVLAGDETAFDELFERHAADALWFARETLGSWSAAEEAVRHSFAAAHAYLASRGPDVEFAPWLHTILANHCLSMLHARTPGPAGSRDAKVVDLATWRRARGKLAGALPLAPTALKDVMGLGAAGAATAGAPLLGGTLAKVALVAVLATGAGVAGDASTERHEPSDPGIRVVAEGGSTPGPAVTPRVGGERSTPTEPAVRSPRDPAPPREADRRGSSPTNDLAPAVDSPVRPVSGGAEAPAATLPASADVETAGLATPVRAALGAVEELTGGSGDSEAPPVPASPDLRRIGDALGVSSTQPPSAVGDLLSRVALGRPR